MFRDFRASKDRRDPQAKRAAKGSREFRVFRVPKARQDLRVSKVSKVFGALLEIRGYKANRAFRAQ